MFPDTVTLRGQKHCYELAKISEQGTKACLLFCVMREQITEFSIAQHIDKDYACAVKYAVSKGVEILCYGCELTDSGIKITHSIPIIL
jgi:sugar fermentation stimulation protein A